MERSDSLKKASPSRVGKSGSIRKSSSGAGPSRRSHTKSRKGCKTCKRRHIRCDETFPQCRNCTKHQVRCDYMDAPPPTDDASGNAPVPGLYWSQEIESIIEHWERSGEATLGSFTIDLRAQGHRYTKSDLHLIYFVLAAGQSQESREFTVWTCTTAQTLAAARTQPFLVHAILAFSALSLAWESNSSEIKSLAYTHGGIALEGLQHAISSFSRENSDAVLLASILLSWQANDWRSWVSLTSGIRTVVNSMQPFKHESTVGHVVDEQEHTIPESFPSLNRIAPDEEFHRNYVMSLSQMIHALDGLQPYHHGRKEQEWFDQLKDYLQQLQSARPANTPQEQFNHLYHFRKFLFWIPASALKNKSRDYMTLVSLAYLYSIALQMEPLFPNVAAAFCSRMVLRPLEEIFAAMDHLQHTSMPGDEQVQNLQVLLQYPRQIVATYHAARQMRDAAMQATRRTPPGFDSMTTELEYSIEQSQDQGHRSPAFGAVMPIREDSVASSRDSPYLNVPQLSINTGAQLPGHDAQPEGLMTLPSMPDLQVVEPTPIGTVAPQLPDYGATSGPSMMSGHHVPSSSGDILDGEPRMGMGYSHSAHTSPYQHHQYLPPDPSGASLGVSHYPRRSY